MVVVWRSWKLIRLRPFFFLWYIRVVDIYALSWCSQFTISPASHCCLHNFNWVKVELDERRVETLLINSDSINFYYSAEESQLWRWGEVKCEQKTILANPRDVAHMQERRNGMKIIKIKQIEKIGYMWWKFVQKKKEKLQQNKQNTQQQWKHKTKVKKVVK